MKHSLRIVVAVAALAIAAPVRAQSPASAAPPNAYTVPSPPGAHMHHHAMHRHRAVHHTAVRESTADRLNRQELAHLQDVGGTPVLRMPVGGKVLSK